MSALKKILSITLGCVINQSVIAGNFFDLTLKNSVINITTLIPNHFYPAASLVINDASIRFSTADCDQIIENRCIFSVSNTQPKHIAISGTKGLIPLTLCLNGYGRLSCQNYKLTLVNYTATVGSVTIDSPQYPDGVLHPLTYFSREAGLTWSEPILPPLPADGVNIKLGGVACLTDGLCIASGYSSNYNYAIFYTSQDGGKTWQISTTVNPPAGGTATEINGLSCAENGNCVAVGKTDLNGITTSLTIIKTGITWELSPAQPQPPPTSTSNQLWGVTCSDDGLNCVGAGWTSLNGEPNIPLTYHSTNGGLTWSNATLLNLPTSQDYTSGVLYGVSCSSDGLQCVSVGYVENSASTSIVPVSYRSNNGGNTWEPAILPLIPIGSVNSEFKSIACDAQGLKCVGVGATVYSNGNNANLIYRTNNGGQSWSMPIQPAAISGSSNNKLNGVSCLNTGGICIAVGHDSFTPYSYTSFDGGITWIGPQTMSIIPETNNSDLFAVSGK